MLYITPALEKKSRKVNAEKSSWKLPERNGTYERGRGQKPHVQKPQRQKPQETKVPKTQVRLGKLLSLGAFVHGASVLDNQQKELTLILVPNNKCPHAL